MDGRQVRSLADRLAADRFPYGAAAGVHRLPHQQQLQHHEHDLHFVSPDRLQQCENAGDHTRDFPTTCENCHDTIQWTDGKFDHSQTGFPLTGSHTVPPRACTDCHVNNNYNITNTTCISCHQNDFNGANSPVPHSGIPDHLRDLP